MQSQKVTGNLMPEDNANQNGNIPPNGASERTNASE